jgi:hypothetical protein
MQMANTGFARLGTRRGEETDTHDEHIVRLAINE